ncbi:NDP-sugar epimerase, includes UDP-GlcNAc-inverting 4,6-dehydratase FlaA1 and capsular polysaccharide biosynthesis protein EpsC [Prevotella aff. ruminicola Tc2-24]|uniref:NDP-sugar epimerase, includes UDP-GlcNAc-inverting 4,6-dehydratase FlaA1 and capsular polysaccharide biosynthesis protein EpsC n=1 Tax=Prevotella aff. ruminicola Tc2-24 TaxID=81582 RepID=A0A1I0M335_9BACT|nr:nucleoside-diphosphate sugar epimerase/dehydratase [Prevotella aff. ruminicola Tc2-24]SEV82847.1 NDP-sugar epimerase, includes UDP-GlcNAc-inverting 4,6-dehydratase FlaA1 and capsular polysaccharide biosynthesis protein EpsC [Prevotella aff. ruminicola Tc2-24]
MGLFYKLFNWYFSRNALPYWCIFIIDGLTLLVSGIAAFWIFESGECVSRHFWPLIATLMIYLMLSVFGVRLFHTYTGVIRFTSFVDLRRVAYANILSLGLSLLVHYILLEVNITTSLLIPLHSRHLVTMFIIATLLMWAIRILVKTMFDVIASSKRGKRVLIYGAMSGGVGLAKNIRDQHPVRFIVKGFITHNPSLRHNQLMGEKVYTLDDNLMSIIRKEGIEGIIVSPVRAQDFRNQQGLQDMLISAGVKIYMATTAQEWTGDENEKAVFQMTEVSVEDLLPRAEINVDMKSVGELLKGRRVLITGSAGSIGSEMVRQVALFNPAAMLLVDQAETPEHDIRLMMSKDFPDIDAETVVTSICNQSRMEKIFDEFRPDYVFHAAAYKHVPMMEDNPSEAVHNNIYGTKVIADLSVKYGVKKFVMVSTDKAVNPTNVMGCSKRICEIYVQSLDRAIKMSRFGLNGLPKVTAGVEHPVTQFVTTRFGNVLGSNGSVIPLFREQIRNGGPVTVTHKDIIRFFMLIPEACKLVLEAGTKGCGGEIFVFDMGKPVRIADLAQRMIRLSGAKNVKIEYTGLRPGEKLYEEVLDDMENTKPTFHEKIRIAEVRERDYAEVRREVDELIAIAEQYDNMATVKKMKEIVPEYKSNNSIYEQLDEAKVVNIS